MFTTDKPAAAPAVRVEPHFCDDDLDERYGQPVGTSYLCGGVEVYQPHEAGAPVLLLIDDIEAMALTPTSKNIAPFPAAAISALLSDPRVQAALASA